ncbi:hypothetical protein [Paenibacillus konkukensis]|uniref:hypothetical protein n=1 Tax=Paenibacillus konkukensis TaxID=2020716 RepID=UPI00201DF246|nr:hypothetical protein [Paenibacillus konkukensis]
MDSLFVISTSMEIKIAQFSVKVNTVFQTKYPNKPAIKKTQAKKHNKRTYARIRKHNHSFGDETYNEFLMLAFSFLWREVLGIEGKDPSFQASGYSIARFFLAAAERVDRAAYGGEGGPACQFGAGEESVGQHDVECRKKRNGLGR